MSLVGGTSQSKPIDDNVKKIVGDIQPKVEEKQNAKYDTFEPVIYKSQIVNGTNYFIKIKVADGNFLHLRVHKSFQGELTLAGVQENKLEEEEIAYF